MKLEFYSGFYEKLITVLIYMKKTITHQATFSHSKEPPA